MCDSWQTARRFGRWAPCPFGCPRGEESLQHFAQCPCLAELGYRHLRLPRPSPAARLSCFIALGPTFSEDTAPLLARRALAAHCACAASCAARHSSTADAAGAWWQYGREACAAHPALAARVAAAWQGPHV
eukprot:8595232-Pyramimonas_sp.AAC.1